MSLDGVAPWLGGVSLALLAQASSIAEPIVPALVGGLGIGGAMYLILTRTLPAMQAASQSEAQANRIALETITARFDAALRDYRSEAANERALDRAARAETAGELARAIAALAKDREQKAP